MTTRAEFDGVSIVTTTWNEEENIGNLVKAIRQVLGDLPHEIIVIDDSSLDGTLEIAKRVADVAISKKREGQTKGLLFGMRQAKYSDVVTIDADLENDPKHIPRLLEQLREFDVVVASRTKIPRFSEKVASKTLGKLLGVSDTFSNYRGYRKELMPKFVLRDGETFGAELLVIAKRTGLRIGEFTYSPPPRRVDPRIGGAVKANLRIFWALAKSLILFL